VKTLLLIQVRDRLDPMAAHELDCVVRRLGRRKVQIRAVNALIESPDPRWASAIDGCIIGGSGKYSVHHRESRPWVDRLRRVMDGLIARQVPTFGICFGHQLLGYHLGRRVSTVEDHAELGTIHLSLTDAGERDPVFGVLERDFHAHTGHSDHVDDVPEGVELLATSDRLHTQAFRMRDAPVYSTQFHPDMTGAEALSRYLAYQANLDATRSDAEQPTKRQFEPGADATSTLLGQFVDKVTASGPA
jgi:GMP synthase (glutamine-hydrolysing)